MDKLERQRRTLFLKMSQTAMRENKPVKKSKQDPKKNNSTIKPKKGCGGCRRKRKQK